MSRLMNVSILFVYPVTITKPRRSGTFEWKHVLNCLSFTIWSVFASMFASVFITKSVPTQFTLRLCPIALRMLGDKDKRMMAKPLIGE